MGIFPTYTAIVCGKVLHTKLRVRVELAYGLRSGATVQQAASQNSPALFGSQHLIKGRPIMFNLKNIAAAVATVVAVGLLTTPAMARDGSGSKGGSSGSSSSSGSKGSSSSSGSSTSGSSNSSSASSGSSSADSSSGRRGRGADDGAGHISGGHGTDDAVGHLSGGHGADDAVGHISGGHGVDDAVSLK